MRFNDYKFSSMHSDNSQLLYKSNENEKTSFFKSFMILLNCGISTDPFFMAYSFRTGIIKAFLLCLLAVVLTQISFHIFVKTWSFDTDNSYPAIWVKCFGPSLKFIPHVLLLCALTSISVIVTEEVPANIDNLLEPYVSEKSLIRNSMLQMYIITFLVTIPVFFCKKVTGLWIISTIANIGIVVGDLCVVINMIISIAKNGFHPENVVLWDNSMDTTVECFGLFNTVFFLHPMVSLVSPEMDNCSREKVLKLSWTTTLSSAAINLICGYCGYLTFYGTNGEDNILFAYDPKSPLTIIGKLGCYMSVLFTTSIYNYIIGDQLASLFLDRYRHRDYAPLFIGGLVILCFNAGFDYGGDTFLNVFKLLGNVAFLIVAFVLPSVFYIYMDKFKSIAKSIGCIIEVLVSGTICIYMLINEIRSMA